MSEQSVILLVEDAEDDILLIQKALAKGRVTHPLQIVRGGEEALAYLRGDGKYSSRAEYPLPELVLLDLKMPGMDGFEVLEWIRKHPTFRAMRVVVMTSSDEIRDVNRAYQLGANSFLVKPMDFQNYIQLGQLLQNYWLSIDKGPSMERPPRKNGQEQKH